jgi:acyl dehydratase
MLTPEEMIGRTFPPTPPYEVSRAKIAEFAQALSDPNPAYYGDNPIAPPTFAAVLAAQAWAQMFADPELDLELKRIVHTDQHFEWNRAIRAGDVIQGSVTLEELRFRGLQEHITIAVHLMTTEGEEIGISRSTLIHHRATPRGPLGPDGKPLDPNDPRRFQTGPDGKPLDPNDPRRGQMPGPDQEAAA